MPSSASKYLSVLFLMCSVSAAIANDLCVESGLASISPRKDCRTIEVKLLDGNGEHTVKMAQAFKEMYRHDTDRFHTAYNFAVQTPDGEIFFLGEFKPWGTSLFQLIWSDALGMRRIYSATASIRGDELFERMLHRENGQFCVLYKMKQPFLGEAQDCSGDFHAHIRNFSHNIGVQLGVLAPSEAWLEACKVFLNGKTEYCRENYVNHSATIVLRTDGGNLKYVVELSNYFDDLKTSRKNRPNYLIFVIDPILKGVRFVSANEKNLGHKELVEIGRN